MSELDSVLNDMRPELDGMASDQERKQAVIGFLDEVAVSGGGPQVTGVVKALYEYGQNKNPKFVELVHTIIESTATGMQAAGMQTMDDYKASETVKFKTLTDFAASYGVDTASAEGFTLFKQSTEKLLNIVANLAEVPDEKYNDADALFAAVKAAFPEKQGNPLRRTVAPKAAM